ncbi:helix-turn-helix transcriptional regulator [Klebsiella aerogenes]|uniref:helix-turn-helix transcriptional regulator n=1 Tax=Klebsiella aerogenes TaxID=548 RepID=UPI00351D0591
MMKVKNLKTKAAPADSPNDGMETGTARQLLSAAVKGGLGKVQPAPTKTSEPRLSPVASMLKEHINGTGITSSAGKLQRSKAAGEPKVTEESAATASNTGTEKGLLDQDQFLRVDDVADMIGISTKHIYALVKRGEFPVQYRFGRCARWSLREVNSWLEARSKER